MIHIESRTIDGIQVVHDFPSADALLANLNSDFSSIGDNQILLVVLDGCPIFSSQGKGEDSRHSKIRTIDVISWFEKVS